MKNIKKNKKQNELIHGGIIKILNCLIYVKLSKLFEPRKCLKKKIKIKTKERLINKLYIKTACIYKCLSLENLRNIKELIDK